MFETEALQRSQCLFFEEWNASLFDLYISEFNLTALIANVEVMAVTARVLEVNKLEQYREKRPVNQTKERTVKKVSKMFCLAQLSSLNVCATPKESSSLRERNASILGFIT